MFKHSRTFVARCLINIWDIHGKAFSRSRKMSLARLLAEMDKNGIGC